MITCQDFWLATKTGSHTFILGKLFFCCFLVHIDNVIREPEALRFVLNSHKYIN